MSHNLKENDEDISNLEEVFDDNMDNIDKISKDDGSVVTDLEPSEDNKKNDSGQEIVQEESATEHKDVGGADVQGDEEQKGIGGGEEEEGEEEEKEEEAEPEEEPELRPTSADGEGIHLNKATFEQLRDLGFSVTQATRVITYRERNDGFSSLNDLDNVPGMSGSFLREVKQKLAL